MPTTAELLQDINERMPNRFSEATKVRWLNTFQKQVFRKLNLPGIFNFDTINGVGAYPLPQSCSMDLIEEVVYDGVHLEYRSLQQEAIGTFYYNVAGSMGIYPRPTENGKSVTIFYKRRPIDLTVEDKDTQKPEIDEDYHEVLVLNVLITMAKANEDPELANAYTYDLNELMLNMQMDLIERAPEYTHTRDVMKSSNTVSEEVGF